MDGPSHVFFLLFSKACKFICSFKKHVNYDEDDDDELANSMTNERIQ